MIISAYILSLTNCDGKKEALCENLNFLIKSTPASDKLIVLDDFSARVCSDHESCKGVLGPHRLRMMNRNGLLLVTAYAEYIFTITNTLQTGKQAQHRMDAPQVHAVASD